MVSKQKLVQEDSPNLKADSSNKHSDIELSAYQFWKIQSRLAKLCNRLRAEQRIIPKDKRLID